MWEILFGYALGKIFDCDRDAFEIGDKIVQTQSSEDVSSPSISQDIVDTMPTLGINAASIRSDRTESRSRPMIQVGFNPFGPVLIYGAEQLLKLAGQDPYSKGEVY